MQTRVCIGEKGCCNRVYYVDCFPADVAAWGYAGSSRGRDKREGKSHARCCSVVRNKFREVIENVPKNRTTE
ncbi:MAG: hypothetical protein Q4A57_06755 [Porphyromonas circumdentaria]|nr:hypothetical protein [Porphyromonas circumdentaria]